MKIQTLLFLFMISDVTPCMGSPLTDCNNLLIVDYADEFGRLDIKSHSGAVEFSTGTILNTEQAIEVRNLLNKLYKGQIDSWYRAPISSFEAMNALRFPEIREALDEELAAQVETFARTMTRDAILRGKTGVTGVKAMLFTETGNFVAGHAHGVGQGGSKKLDFVVYSSSLIGVGTEYASDLSINKPRRGVKYLRTKEKHTLLVADTWHRSAKGNRLVVLILVSSDRWPDDPKDEHSSQAIGVPVKEIPNFSVSDFRGFIADIQSAVMKKSESRLLPMIMLPLYVVVRGRNQDELLYLRSTQLVRANKNRLFSPSFVAKLQNADLDSLLFYTEQSERIFSVREYDLPDSEILRFVLSPDGVFRLTYVEYKE